MKEKMKSFRNGTGTLTSSVTNIANSGFWVIVQEKEYFISFKHFPAFKKATIDKIFNIQILSPTQLHWPELDIDIEIDSLEKPHFFPLTYK
jgi:hypothetical protein